MFTPAETEACQRLVEWGLHEDLNIRGDITSLATIPADRPGRAAFTARTAGVIAGLPAADLVLQAVAANLHLQLLVADGAHVDAGAQLAIVSGPMRGILVAER